jgi:hypothetical protein
MPGKLFLKTGKVEKWILSNNTCCCDSIKQGEKKKIPNEMLVMNPSLLIVSHDCISTKSESIKCNAVKYILANQFSNTKSNNGIFWSGQQIK